jgi:signal transduction histidine kinase
MDTPEVRIAQLEAELAACKREMQEFTYTVSHDLRAPLRHIVSFAQLVQEDAGPLLNAEVQGFLDTIAGSARNLTAMLDALLELSRVGSVALHSQRVALQDMVQSVSEELSDKFPSDGRTWHIAPGLPQVTADPALLRVALMHLLGNALKFSRSRTPAVIEIGGESDVVAGITKLTIRDNGVGYNPVMQGKLFQVFSRLHSQTQFEGLGMGLALSRKIAQRLGAELAISGKTDLGCCVTLTLPLAAP